MTVNSDLALLGALAEAGEKMTALFRWLDSKEHPAPTTRGSDIRRYDDADVIEYYVERELAAGLTVTYWLEVRSSGGRIDIEAAGLAQEGDRQRTVVSKEFSSNDDDRFIPNLTAAADFLWERRAMIYSETLRTSRGA